MSDDDSDLEMSDDDSDLEVYMFQGKKGEKVPEEVQNLIVNPGVRILPSRCCSLYFCLQEVTLTDGLIRIMGSAFHTCENLLEIKIPSTVQFIGKYAFACCALLEKVEFEETPNSPPQLELIDQRAFHECGQLPRIKLPSSVTAFGERAFDNCIRLLEANLSTSGITDIAPSAFDYCLVVPEDVQPISIGEESFFACRRLANFALPENSTAKQDSFDECDALHKRYGVDSTSIVAGLVSRFDDFPIHKMCYDNFAVTADKLRQCNEEGQDSLVDAFGMTPFHVLFSTVEPSGELLEVLLDHYPHHMLKWEDGDGNRPLDYLKKNWSDANTRLFEITLRKWMIDAVARWGPMSWMEPMESKVQAVLSGHDTIQWWIAHQEVYSVFERYKQMAGASILELALWKEQLLKGGDMDEERRSLGREEHRCLCGADVVIPIVFEFLGLP